MLQDTLPAEMWIISWSFTSSRIRNRNEQQRHQESFTSHRMVLGYVSKSNGHAVKPARRRSPLLSLGMLLGSFHAAGNGLLLLKKAGGFFSFLLFSFTVPVTWLCYSGAVLCSSASALPQWLRPAQRRYVLQNAYPGAGLSLHGHLPRNPHFIVHLQRRGREETTAGRGNGRCECSVSLPHISIFSLHNHGFTS